MKKRSYRQTDVKNVDWQALREKTENQAIIFAVDVALSAFVGAIVTRDGAILCTLKWTHPVDTRELLEHLLNALGAARLEVVMEPSGTYGDALRYQFQCRHVSVYRVSPKHTHDMAESFDGVPSMHDAKATHVIAELHRYGRSRLWQERSVEQRDLRGLADELEVHQQQHRSHLNRLAALMARHWPELRDVTQLDLYCVLTLLSEYGEPEAVQQAGDAALARLSDAGGRFLSTAKREGIINAAKNSLGVPCTPGERAYIRGLAKDLLRTRKAMQALEKHIGEKAKTQEALRPIVGFCGKATALTLVALLGDLRHYPNPQTLLKAMGLNLKERSSGQHKGQLRITKRGPSRVRFYLYWLALRKLQTDPQVKAWYEAKVARDGGRFKGRAVIAVIRKRVKALWHVAQGEVFDSHKLFQLGMA